MTADFVREKAKENPNIELCSYYEQFSIEVRFLTLPSAQFHGEIACTHGIEIAFLVLALYRVRMSKHFQECTVWQI